jgi:porin
MFIRELWFQQTQGSLRMIFGVQDINVEFAVCCSGGLFLNSSFGIQPNITTNIPASVFPLTSLGLTAVWSSSDHWTWRTAIYDGAPTVFEQNPYNLSWSFRNNEGIINLFEIEYSTTTELIKLGVYHHDHLYELNDAVRELVYEHNVGMYSAADIQLIQISNGSYFYIFGQTGYSSRVINQNYWFGSVGIRCTGIFSDSETDELGAAIACAGMRSLKDETTIELTYKHQVHDLVFIQPDIQYIINPTGTGIELHNSFVCTIRLGIYF